MQFLLDLREHEFLQHALLGLLLVSVSCGMTGVYIVRRRMAYLGDAMAHGVLPGVALAWMGGYSLFLGGLAAGITMALLIGWIASHEKVREDAAIGVTFTSLFALGVVLMSTQKSYRDFQHLLLGNILGVTGEDLGWLGLSALAVIVILLVFHKELELTTYDPDYAAITGISPAWMRLLLLVTLAFAVISAIQAVGVVLTGAMLITPALTVSLVCHQFKHSMVLAPLLAIVAGVGGLTLSFYYDLPAGATIVLCSTALFMVVHISKTSLFSEASVQEKEEKKEILQETR
jgi:manganese/iron transport system permease protein